MLLLRPGELPWECLVADGGTVVGICGIAGAEMPLLLSSKDI